MAWTTPILIEICVGLEINANHLRAMRQMEKAAERR